jgi:Predicted glycosyltransferases
LKPLSFVIITYNRPADTLDLLRNITTLNRAAELLEEVIVVNNASTESYEAVKAFIAANPLINFRFIDSPENLGVAKGRNLAIGHAKAPILILLDDDAELENKDALENIVELFEEQKTPGRPLGIISFKVLYHSNHQMQVNAFPHKQFEEHKDLSFFIPTILPAARTLLKRGAGKSRLLPYRLFLRYGRVRSKLPCAGGGL